MTRSPYIDEAVRLFDAGDYFLAHETLEEHWIDAPSEERDFLQGIIHLAVGFLHLGRGNKRGAGLQFGKALVRLVNYPAQHEGLDVETIRQFLRSAPAALEEGSDLQPPRLA